MAQVGVRLLLTHCFTRTGFWMSMEAAGARKRKSPAFAGLFEEFHLLVGACWSSLGYYLAETEGFEPSIQV